MAASVGVTPTDSLQLGLLVTRISAAKYPYFGRIPVTVQSLMAEHRAEGIARLTADGRAYDTTFQSPIVYSESGRYYRQDWAVMLIDPHTCRPGEVVYAAAFPGMQKSAVVPLLGPVDPAPILPVQASPVVPRPPIWVFARYGEGWVSGPGPLGWRRIEDAGTSGALPT